MNGIKDYKEIEVFGQTVKICDLSLEYVRKTQSEQGFDSIENAMKDACEIEYNDDEVGYKAGKMIYEAIIKHTFGESDSEDSGDAKK